MERTMVNRQECSRRAGGGFTLVELLVVISVIALLISILLPSLKSARDQAKAVKCAANARSVGQALSTFLVESNAYYPPSYLYPPDEHGSIDPTELNDIVQNASPVPYGYLHWSHFLYSSGKVGDEAFQCPNYERGGAPRTNPGMGPEDWEGGQIDAGGNSSPNSLRDKQAPRMAFAANAAIIPRNKFTSELSGGLRRNVLVQENRIKRPGDTILATEYLKNWRALGEQSSGQVLSKSHRPINVFYHLGSSHNEYQAATTSPGFIYGTKGNARTADDYGLLTLSEVNSKSYVLDYNSGIAQINAVGRSHPGGDSVYGGTANFLFVDTHVERMTPLKSMQERRWGDRYYSINGANEVINMGAPQD